MKFDCAIIGGGLAGLICGISLNQAGLRCVIISRGESALHFSSASLDLLATLPGGESVTDVAEGITRLSKKLPDHPYVKLGSERVMGYALQTEALLARCGIMMQGHASQPHYRITPLGTLRPAWLSPLEIPLMPLSARQVKVIGISGFADFQPMLVADSLKQQGVNAQAEEITLPLLDRLRDNPSEFRSVNIARILDEKGHWPALLSALQPLAQGCDLLLMPACFGLRDNTLYNWLQEQLPCPLRLLPTLPPSVIGIRLHNQLRRQFITSGGTWLAGDEVTQIHHQNGAVDAIFTSLQGDIPLQPKFTVLASGRFFSNGLIADKDAVREPILDLELLHNSPRKNWYQRDFFLSQPWQHFGLKTDDQLRPLLDGQPLNNLFAIGSLLGGYDAIQLGCGGGICAVSALYVAQQIQNIIGGRHER